MTTTIKITELTDIGANLASSTVLPVVNMSGTPTTQKTVLGNIANVILEGAGTDYSPVGEATLAGTVTTNAQPNITSVGSLTGLTVSNSSGVVNFSNTANVTLGAIGNLHISGGTAGQLLSTNGNGTLSWASDTTTYGNSNVAAYLPTYAGNVGANWVIASYFMGNAHNLTYLPGANVNGAVPYATTANSVAAANVSGLGNIATVNLTGSSSNVLYGNGVFAPVTGGDVQSKIANGTSNVTITPSNGPVVINVNGTEAWTFSDSGNLQTAGDIVGPAGANLVIYANAGVHEFIFGNDGTFYAPDNVVLGGNAIYIGPGANTLTGVEHEVLLASSNNFAYVQGVINNVSDNGSAEWVALGAKGNDAGGWAEVGFTSSGFGDANYTITGAGDGYVFAQSYAPGQTLLGGGGNLILATGNQGSVKDIIFGTGGFLTSNIFGRISDANNALELSRTNSNINLVGGGGIIGAGNLYLYPDTNNTGSYLDIFLTSGPDLHLVASAAANLILGKDAGPNVMTSWDGNVYVQSWNTGSNTQGGVWNFDQGGNLTAPGAINVGNMSIGALPGYITADANTGIILNTSGSDGGFVVDYLKEDGNANTSGGELAFSSELGNATYRISLSDDMGDGFATKIWRFDGTGNLTLPGNTFAVNYANGTQVPLGGGGNTGNVTFNNQVVQGTGDEYGGSGLYLAPGTNSTANLQYLQVRGGDYPTHIHLDTGNNNYFDQYFGADSKYVKLEANGNVVINADNGNSATWTFDTTGNFHLADGNSVIQSVPNNAGDGSGLSTLNLIPDNSTGDDRYLIIDPTGPAHLHLRAGGLQDASNVLLYLGGEQTYVQVDDGYHRVTIGSYDNANATGYNWRFDYDGNLVLPLNTFAVKYANGTQVPIVSSASGSNNQIQFNSNGSFGASGNYTFTDTVGGGSVEVGNELLLLGNGTISTASNNLNIQPAGNLVVTASAYNWTFDTAGNLTLPGNTFAVNYANGTQVSLGGGSYGDSNVVSLLSAFGSNTITTTGNVSVGNIIGNGQSLTGIAGSNVTGQVSNSLVAGTVYTAAQPNITSVGTLTSLTVSGNVTAQGVGTNLVRRANTIGGSNTVVTLDNLTALVGGSPTRLYIGAATSNMTMAGTSQTMVSGSMAVSSWINLPISTGVGNGFAVGGAISSAGDTVVLNITDQGAGSGTWRVTGMIANTSANLYSVSIERLA